MYQGYRIKINGNIVDNTMIIRGSYSAWKEQRVLHTSYDATGTKHEELSPRKTTVINFTIRSHDLTEHAEVMKILEVENNVTVEYWDDKKMSYSTGIFKIERYTFKHKNAFKNDISYDNLPITLKEY